MFCRQVGRGVQIEAPEIRDLSALEPVISSREEIRDARPVEDEQFLDSALNRDIDIRQRASEHAQSLDTELSLKRR